MVRLIEEQFAALGVTLVGWRAITSPLEQMLAHAADHARRRSCLINAGAWQRAPRISRACVS